MAVSKRLRYEVLRRDNHACRYCGSSAPDVSLTIDHVVPESLGGTDEPTNLVSACSDCNSGKASSAPNEGVVDNVAHDAERWSAAMREAAEVAAAERAARDWHREAFRHEWSSWTLTPYVGKPYTPALPDDWPETIDRLCAAGLQDEDIADAITQTMHSTGYIESMFRYFCGICWRMIRDHQQIATDLLSKDDD